MVRTIVAAILLAVVTSLAIYCPPGQYFDGQHCEACQANCVCTSMGGCNSCITGYTFNLDQSACVACPAASPGNQYSACTECCMNPSGTSLSCTDCDTTTNQGSTFLMSGRCLVKQGCFQIDSQGFCTSCRNGYYFTDNACIQCDVSCLTCLGNDNCQVCASGYYNTNTDGAKCTACPTGCAECTITGSCSLCSTGYYLYNTQCLTCPTNCATCTDGSTCSSCTHGILVSNLCVLCTDTTYGGSVGCTSCYASNSFVVCNTCADTYYLDGSYNCQLCSSAISNAVRCLDSMTPTQCKDDYDAVLTNRYYLLSVSCVSNVNSCRRVTSIAGDCVSCYTGYYLSGSNVCVQCPFTGCAPANTSVVSNVCTCTACLSGYRLNGVACQVCITANCDLCAAAAATCTQCKTGFYLSGAVCAATTLTGCKVASAVATCTTCNDGYYLGSDATCYLCETNCNKCTGKYVCTSCAVGYYLVGQGNCYAYSSNCLTMNVTSNSCLVCNHGYVLYKGICKECSVEKGTLQLCSGLCPLDNYIENVLIANDGWRLTMIALALLLLIAV